MLKTCPNPVEVQELQFKLHCRLKIFNNSGLDTFPNSHSLISCASRYGLLFVGSNSSNLQVIQLKCVENYSPKDKDVQNYPRRNIALSSPPKHVCVNCDSTILAVVIEKDKCPAVVFYDVLSFLKQNVTVIKEARLSSTPGICVTEINWNPALPPIFTACKSDGTLGIYEIRGTSIDINELPSAAKQLAFVGVLKENIKVINEPPLSGSHSLISLQWVSNYQFIGIYQSAEPEGPAKLIVVDAPKTGEASYMNYEDVCYSGTTRLPQFYTILLQHWNILMVASSNSTEVGVLASTGDSWTQWILADSARAELPLSSDHQETLPIGLALDISSTKPLPWNESSIPPCPYLLLFSDQGILCLFNIVNLKQGIPSICTPPDPISDVSGIGQFVTISDNVSAPQSVAESLKTTIPTFSFAAAQSTAVSQAPTFGATVLTQPQPTYRAPSSLFGKTPESKPLFEVQSVLTPINPQQPTTQASIFGGQTLLTPISKPQTNVTTNNPASVKYSSIFSALNAPAPMPVATQSKPIVISTRPTSKSTELPAEEQVEVPPKATISTKSVESVPAVDIKVKSEIDPLLARMVKDECISLESELQAILHQGRLVHYLKQNLIQSWAWFEEARSRYNSSKDETISLLLRAQPLDSATDKRQTDIRKLMYYIESQITQASKALDEQWDNFQDYAKKIHRTQMPTMEAIFQAMVRQNAIIQKQNYVMKDIASRLKNKGHPTIGPSLLVSMESTEDLVDDLKRLQLQHPQDMYQIQYERVLNRIKKFSGFKSNKLRQLLKNREVLHVTVVKPQFTSSLLMQSPASKKLASDLQTVGIQMSRVSKTGAVPKNLNFLHSTPIRETKPEIKPTATPPNTPAQTDPKGFSFKKVEKSNSAFNLITTSSSFVPLSRSTSVSSNLPQGHSTQSTLPTHALSAFVPTTQVSFGASNKPFSFPPAATTTATVLKTVTTVNTTTTTSSDIAGPALHKFVPVVPKTTSLVVTTASSIKISTPTVKTSLPQFSFGSGISITPISTTKKIESTSAPMTTSIFGSVSTTKPTFTFSNTSNIFGAKVGVDSGSSTNKTETTSTVTTNTAPLFPTLSSQGSKTLFGTTTTSSGTFTFGAVSSTTKVSAFSAVTTRNTNIASITAPISVTAANTSEPKMVVSSSTTVTQPSMLVINPVAANTSAKTTSSIFSNFANSTSVSTAATNVPIPIFGSPVSSTKTQSIFASTPLTTESSSTPTTSISVLTSSTFTTKPSSIFSTILPTSTTTTTTTTAISSSGLSVFSSITTATAKPLVFSAPLITSSTSGDTSLFTTSVASTKPSVFASGAVTNTTATVTTTQSLPFSGTQDSVIDSTCDNTNSITKPSIFGTATAPTQPSIFGISSPAKTFQTSIFGGTSITTQSSIFGTTTTETASKPSVFGTAIVSSQPSIFGTNTATTTQQVSIFENNTATNQTSIFGTASGNTPQISIFGASASTSITKPSIFGATTSATATQSSIFAVSSTPSTSGSLFRAPITAASPFGSAFSSAPTSAASSPFGQSNSVFGTPKTTPSPFNTTFGSPTVFGSTPATTATVFGQPSFGSASTSVFGTPTTSTNIFGSSSGGSTFGAVSSSANVFGSPAVSSPSFSFAGAGGNANNTGAFGFGGLNVGSTATTSSSIFGGSASFGQSTATSANPFGRVADQKLPFGCSTNIFGTPASTSSSIFGSNTASTFGSGTQSGFGTSAFGSSSGFGQQPAFGQSAFGNSSFGSPQPQPGPFSGGSTGVGQSGFGSPPSFQKPPAFGAAPVFGGSPQPAFGAAPSFGGAPAFGTAPSFGSPNKVFGTNPPTGGFVTTASGSPGFGNLANQNTVGFGNLAQQAATSNLHHFQAGDNIP
ncbi:hypothetical protein NQ314_020851 [Rhamnusium bicolor]|uniref:Nucleoporin Nup159/Nup146 N-terminal domain-containing protein n=1 Tax=Rhamnusium bicolor TaxID=1586634 RepID=A0AAV8WJU6_9CUCU|nr:hypothetical protein NQ314_020851 [Rhamnusium bicolor]